MLRTICYGSTASPSLDKQALSALYDQVIDHNLKNYITGVLLFSDGNFMQIMEGEVDKMEQLYSDIEKDDRHHHLIKLIDTEIKERLFENYSNGVTIVKDERATFKLNLYLKWLKDNFGGNVSKLSEIIRPFLKDV